MQPAQNGTAIRGIKLLEVANEGLLKLDEPVYGVSSYICVSQ